MAVNQKRLVEEFEKLVSIDSLSFQERKMADYLKERWQELGVTLAEDDAAARRLSGSATSPGMKSHAA